MSEDLRQDFQRLKEENRAQRNRILELEQRMLEESKGALPAYCAACSGEEDTSLLAAIHESPPPPSHSHSPAPRETGDRAAAAPLLHGSASHDHGLTPPSQQRQQQSQWEHEGPRSAQKQEDRHRRCVTVEEIATAGAASTQPRRYAYASAYHQAPQRRSTYSQSSFERASPLPRHGHGHGQGQSVQTLYDYHIQRHSPSLSPSPSPSALPARHSSSARYDYGYGYGHGYGYGFDHGLDGKQQRGYQQRQSWYVPYHEFAPKVRRTLVAWHDLGEIEGEVAALRKNQQLIERDERFYRGRGGYSHYGFMKPVLEQRSSPARQTRRFVLRRSAGGAPSSWRHTHFDYS